MLSDVLAAPRFLAVAFVAAQAGFQPAVLAPLVESTVFVFTVVFHLPEILVLIYQ